MSCWSEVNVLLEWGTDENGSGLTPWQEYYQLRKLASPSAVISKFKEEFLKQSCLVEIIPEKGMINSGFTVPGSLCLRAYYFLLLNTLMEGFSTGSVLHSFLPSTLPERPAVILRWTWIPKDKLPHPWEELP